MKQRTPSNTKAVVDPCLTCVAYVAQGGSRLLGLRPVLNCTRESSEHVNYLLRMQALARGVCPFHQTPDIPDDQRADAYLSRDLGPEPIPIEQMVSIKDGIHIGEEEDRQAGGESNGGVLKRRRRGRSCPQ